MANAAKVKINVTNKIVGVTEPANGVSFFIGPTKTGPVEDPKDLITSWPQYVKIFGGEVPDNKFSTMVKRYLESGGSARICRILHNDAAKAAAVAILDDSVSADELFKIVPKYEGEEANGWKVKILQPSNDEDDFFDLMIDTGNSETIEYYRNLTITGDPTVDHNLPQNYLKDIVDNSNLVDVVYETIDYSITVEPPKVAEYQFSGGSDGTAVSSADYTAVAFESFNNYNEAYHVAALGMYDSAVHVIGIAYANKRKDLFYFCEIDPTKKTTTDIKAERDSVNSNSKYIRYFAGALEYQGPQGSDIQVGNLADVCSKAVLSEVNYTPWLSFSGKKRGVLGNVSKVINNFGSPASTLDMDTLANSQINLVVQRGGEVFLTGNFTGLNYNSQEQWANVVKLVMYLRKSLLPTLENYLEEPNDIPTWSQIYYTVKPFFDGLSTGQNRALYDYSWEGDQFASSLDNLQVNKKADVLQGKYKVSLTIIPVASMQEFSLNIILDSSTGSAQIS